MLTSLYKMARRAVKNTPLLLRVLLVVTLIPLVEYAVLVWLSNAIGFTLTLLIVLGSGVAGAWNVRRQGTIAWRRVLRQVRQGDPVGASIFDGALILLAGVLLVMPGVISDLLGFFLLFPKGRGMLQERLSRWLRRKAMMQFESLHADGRFTMREAETASPAPQESGDVIETEPEEASRTPG